MERIRVVCASLCVVAGAIALAAGAWEWTRSAGRTSPPVRSGRARDHAPSPHRVPAAAPRRATAFGREEGVGPACGSRDASLRDESLRARSPAGTMDRASIFALGALLLGDGPDAQKERALQALSRQEDPEVESILVEFLSGEGDLLLRHNAVLALQRHSGPRATQALIAAMRSEAYAPTRMAAAYLLGGRPSGDPSVRDALLRVVRPDPGGSEEAFEVRKAAIHSLGRRLEPVVEEQLLAVAESGAPIDVRAEAVRALASARSASARTRLLALLGDPRQTPLAAALAETVRAVEQNLD